MSHPGTPQNKKLLKDNIGNCLESPSVPDPDSVSTGFYSQLEWLKQCNHVIIYTVTHVFLMHLSFAHTHFGFIPTPDALNPSISITMTRNGFFINLKYINGQLALWGSFSIWAFFFTQPWHMSFKIKSRNPGVDCLNFLFLYCVIHLPPAYP